MELWKTFDVQKQEDIPYYNTSEGFETEGFATHLDRLIREEMAAEGKDGIMFLCIDTDRSVGDSLGSLVRHILRSRRLKGVTVIRMLDKPVHVMNLDSYARYIWFHYSDHVVVAIGAPVGSLGHVGYATLGRGAFQPGLEVSRKLQVTGDIVITGIADGVGSRDPVMLQSVRPSMVMKVADCTYESIFLAERLWENVVIV